MRGVHHPRKSYAPRDSGIIAQPDGNALSERHHKLNLSEPIRYPDPKAKLI
jgi:hypothetical protein